MRTETVTARPGSPFQTGGAGQRHPNRHRPQAPAYRDRSGGGTGMTEITEEMVRRGIDARRWSHGRIDARLLDYLYEPADHLLCEPRP